jgi:hypothetical protein
MHCSSDGADRESRRVAADLLVRVAATRGVASGAPPSVGFPRANVGEVRSLSAAVGVGSSAPCRHVASCRWLAPFPSRAVGVGRSVPELARLSRDGRTAAPGEGDWFDP